MNRYRIFHIHYVFNLFTRKLIKKVVTRGCVYDLLEDAEKAALRYRRLLGKYQYWNVVNFYRTHVKEVQKRYAVQYRVYVFALPSRQLIEKNEWSKGRQYEELEDAQQALICFRTTEVKRVSQFRDGISLLRITRYRIQQIIH